MKVTNVSQVAGDALSGDQQLQQMANAAGDDMLDQMVNSLKDSYGVTVNQAVVNQATNLQ